ncbi:Uncharacterised protein [Mycobacteroides abscessus]|nr:Uncharacterised protein [Mycobacteroides abscessus]
MSSAVGAAWANCELCWIDEIRRGFSSSRPIEWRRSRSVSVSSDVTSVRSTSVNLRSTTGMLGPAPSMWAIHVRASVCGNCRTARGPIPSSSHTTNVVVTGSSAT